MKGFPVSRTLLVAILTVFAATAANAGDPVDLTGTWLTTGTGKFKIQRGGKVQGGLDADISFGPTTVPLLASDQVQIVFDDDFLVLDPVAGTYSEKKPGKGKPTLNLNAQDLGDGILELVQDELPPLPIDITVEILIDKLKAKAKAKSKNGVEGMKLKLKAKGELVLSGGGVSERLKLRFGYKGEGGRAP